MTAEHFKNMRRSSLNINLYNFLIIVMLAAAVVIVYSFSSSGRGMNLFVMCVVFLLTAFSAMLIYMLIKQRNGDKASIEEQQKNFPNMVTRFAFDEEAVTIETVWDGYNGTCTRRYDTFSYVSDTGGYFVIGDRTNSMYVIGKHEITEGNVDELESLFRRKFTDFRKGAISQ